jgi:hypothetical protein
MSRFLLAALIGLAAGYILIRFSHRRQAPEPPDEQRAPEPQESP